jgi:hypothetical protein
MSDDPVKTKVPKPYLYERECPICHTVFRTRDSRVITDKPECHYQRKLLRNRDRYHVYIEQNLTPPWKTSKNRTVQVVCQFIMKSLPAKRSELEADVQGLLLKHNDIKITPNTIQNNLTKLRLTGDIVFDEESLVWRKVQK